LLFILVYRYIDLIGSNKKILYLAESMPKGALFYSIAGRGWIAEGYLGCCMLVAIACKLILLFLYKSALALSLHDDLLAIL
jgi:hypothetical protein